MFDTVEKSKAEASLYTHKNESCKGSLRIDEIKLGRFCLKEKAAARECQQV